MNQIIICGHLTKDPVQKDTERGLMVKFNVASYNAYQKDDDEKKPCYWNVTAYGRHAEVVIKWLRKGSHCTVSGTIKQFTATKDDKTIYGTEIIAERIQFNNAQKNQTQEEGAQ